MNAIASNTVTSLSNILPMGFIVHFILIHFGLLDSDLLDRNLKSILTFGIPVSHLLSKWGVFLIFSHGSRFSFDFS